jgi:peptidoglycan-N-acetylglucosamine deacetylase
MKISILIPVHNEEKSIKNCIDSCLIQSRKPDEIIIVNDGSTDKTAEILKRFGSAIKVISIPNATGNKSYAQEVGLAHIQGDIFICTDGDTIMNFHFVELIEKDFQDTEIAAVAGYVKSMKYNWLTICRAYEYAINQNIHKLAQTYIHFLFVIPGSAGAYRTRLFKLHAKFDHDTLTEDLDTTYKFNREGLRIKYNMNAIVYTQDPVNFKSYVNQMRRWYGGGWQNLMKHFGIIGGPAKALELSLIYIDGFVFSWLFFIIPIINIRLAIFLVFFYLLMLEGFAIFAAIKEKRKDILISPLPYMVLVYINAWIFLEQFFKEVVFKKKNLNWFQPDRV